MAQPNPSPAPPTPAQSAAPPAPPAPAPAPQAQQPSNANAEQEYGVWSYVYSTAGARGLGDWTSGDIEEIGSYIHAMIRQGKTGQQIGACFLVVDWQELWTPPDGSPMALTIYVNGPHSDGNIEVEIYSEKRLSDGYGHEHYDYWSSDPYADEDDEDDEDDEEDDEEEEDDEGMDDGVENGS